MGTRNVNWIEEKIQSCDDWADLSKNFQYARTLMDTSSCPPVRNTIGFILFVAEISTGGPIYGVQYWYSMSLEGIWYREVRDIAGNKTFSDWNKASGDTISNLSEYIKKPESMNAVQNVNRLLYSGIFKTSELNPTTEGLPPNTSKWGVIQHFFENTGGPSHDESKQTGFQLYSPIDGEKYGSLFIRVKKPQVTWANTPWHELKLQSILQMQDLVFTHPTDIATNIDNKNSNGYFVTNETTQGDFPEDIINGERVPENKHGIVKTLASPQGYLIQTYTPLEGPQAGKTYTRIKNPNPTARGPATWENWRKDGNRLHVMKEQDLETGEVTPSEYLAQAGDSVLYEYKLPRRLGLDNEAEKWGLKDAKVVLCKTIIGANNDVMDHVNGSAGVHQIVFLHTTNKILIRHSDAQNFGWQPWYQLNGGEGSKDPVIMDDYFPATDKEPINNANDFKVNGFKKTTVNTAGLPDEVNGDAESLKSRVGVIQFISENETGADTGVQYFIPIQGPYAGQTFTRVRQDVEVQRGARQLGNEKWTQWINETDTKVKISRGQRGQVPSPLNYITGSLKDYVSYEYHFSNDLKLSQENGMVLVKTLVADSQEEQSDGFIYQIAYAEGGKVYQRQYKEGSSSSDFGPWKQINGGSLTPVDYDHELATLINKWYSQS